MSHVRTALLVNASGRSSTRPPTPIAIVGQRNALSAPEDFLDTTFLDKNWRSRLSIKVPGAIHFVMSSTGQHSIDVCTRFRIKDWRHSKDLCNSKPWRTCRLRIADCRAFLPKRYVVCNCFVARSSYVCNPKKCYSGPAQREALGQHGELDIIALASNGRIDHRDAQIKVIGVGARACGILNFCQQSSLLPSAQFWVSSSDSAVQHFQLLHPNNPTSLACFINEGDLLDSPLMEGKNDGVVFLVAGAGGGSGAEAAAQLLKSAQSKGNLTVSIFIQPFMFEGQKRLLQADKLIDSLLASSDLLMVIEHDNLLRREAVTVSEASIIANNTVLLGIKAVSDLLGNIGVSLDITDDRGEITSPDMLRILQKSGKAWVGFGRGNTVVEAIECVFKDFPLLCDLLGSKCLVLCSVASAGAGKKEEAVAAASVLRTITGANVQVVCSFVKGLTKEGIFATIVITGDAASKGFKEQSGCHTSMVCQTSAVDSQGDIAQNALTDAFDVSSVSMSSPNSTTSQTVESSNIDQYLDKKLEVDSGIVTSLDFRSSEKIKAGAAKSAEETTDISDPVKSGLLPIETISGGLQGRQALSAVGPTPGRQETVTLSGNGRTKKKSLLGQPQTGVCNENEQRASLRSQNDSIFQQYVSGGKRFKINDRRSLNKEEVKRGNAKTVTQNTVFAPASKKSRLALVWEAGPSSADAEAWAQARAEARKKSLVGETDQDSSFPIGVRPQVNQAPTRQTRKSPEAIPVDPAAVPRTRVMDIGLGAVKDMYLAASAMVMGTEQLDNRGQGSVSQRAASMLESERSHSKLTPKVEMQFKNGYYKGRCQAGLPEGKGRLTYADGSLYDGQWKQGKRVGAGAFYYTNGDMFQGSWRDDVMHGKGWMYFHTGDRLYANFWKGKANGEGRFYSGQGDVFFGQFRDNWRHGECLFIEASGVTWSEIWDSGEFLSRSPVDS